MTKKIMTVDDSASIRKMVNLTLSRSGYDVCEAVDGKDALEMMKKETVHMVITDLIMPEMDGIELIRHIKINPSYKSIPIIMLTTESEIKKKQEGIAAGVAAWIVKPFQPDKLLSAVKKVLG